MMHQSPGFLSPVPQMARLLRALLLPVLLLCSAGAWAADKTTFKLAHMFAQGSLPDRVAERFASEVASRSRGRMRVVVYPGGQLGDERENIALLRRGNLDFAVTGDVVVSTLGDQYRVINLPFLYQDARHALKTYDSEVGVEMVKALVSTDVVPLSWHYIGMRLLTSRKPVRSAADLKDLKLRLPYDLSWMAAWEALGAIPKHVQFTDLPSALKLGIVDAQENPPNFIRANKLYEHHPYLVLTQHMPQRQFIMSAAALWTRLSGEQRSAVQAAARVASEWASAVAEKEQASDIEWLTREGGMTLLAFDRGTINETLAPLPKKLAGEAGEQLVQRIQAQRSQIPR
jgi:tripartite ATP-independent transporter DctP family solute receptor